MIDNSMIKLGAGPDETPSNFIKQLDWLYVLLLVTLVWSPRVWVGNILGIESPYASINAEDLVVFTIILRWFGRSSITQQIRIRLLLPNITAKWVLLTSVFGLSLIIPIATQGLTPDNYLGVLFYLKWIGFGIMFLVIQTDMGSWTSEKVQSHIWMFMAIGLVSGLYSIVIFGVEGGALRSVTFFVNPNTAGLFFMMFAVVAITQIRVNKRFAFIVLVTSITALVLTGSRGAGIGAVVAAIAIIIASQAIGRHFPQRVVSTLFIGVALFAIFTLLMPRVSEYNWGRWTSLISVVTSSGNIDRDELEPNFVDRFDRISQGNELFLERPFLGHGFRALTTLFLDNQYSILIAETGLLGTLSFLWYWAAIVQYGYRWRHYAMGGGLVALSIGLLAAGVGGESLFVPRVIAIMFVLMSLTAAQVSSDLRGIAYRKEQLANRRSTTQ